MKKRVFVLLTMGLSLYAQNTPHQDQKNQKQQDYDVNSQWYKERMYFNRADWDAEEKKIFEQTLKEKGQSSDQTQQELAIAFAQKWAACSMREKFRTQKGSLAIERSEKYGKEMKQYWDEIYDRCYKARWRYYRMSKALKKQNQEKTHKRQKIDSVIEQEN